MINDNLIATRAAQIIGDTFGYSIVVKGSSFYIRNRDEWLEVIDGLIYCYSQDLKELLDF